MGARGVEARIGRFRALNTRRTVELLLVVSSGPG